MRNVTAMKIKYENYINIIHLRSVPGLTSLFSNLQLRIRVSSLDGGGSISTRPWIPPPSPGRKHYLYNVYGNFPK